MRQRGRGTPLCLVVVLLLAPLLAPALGGAPALKQQRQRQDDGHAQPQEEAFLGVLGAAAVAPSLVAFQAVLQQHNHSLPLPLLHNGIAFSGSAGRLRRLVAKAVAGRPLHISLLGSSSSTPGLQHQQQQHANNSSSGGAGTGSSEPHWFGLFASWLRTTFPAAQLTARSGAVAGARSESLAACLQQRVEPHTDLVLLEVSAADGFLPSAVNNELVLAYERLVRQLLQLPGRPAVVAVHGLALPAVEQQAKPQKQQQTKQQTKQQSKQQQQQTTPAQHRSFYASAEDQYGVVAQFYALPTLSLRNAVWQAAVAGLPGFRAHDLFVWSSVLDSAPAAAAAGGSLQQHSRTQHLSNSASSSASRSSSPRRPPEHPPAPSALAHRYLADLAIALVQQTFVQQLLAPLPPGDGDGAAAAAAGGGLPPPLFPGNWESHGVGCATGVELRAAAPGPHPGFYFVAEGSPAHPRWGFVSEVPNATLVLQLDTRSKGAQAAVARLSYAQKLALLQAHGMHAAAAELAAAHANDRFYGGGGPAVGVQRAAGGSSSSAGLSDEELHAAAFLQRLRDMPGQKQAGGYERLVGANHATTLTLPASARLEVGKMKTATGVEVVASSSGHRRQRRLAWQLHGTDDAGASDSGSGSSGRRAPAAAAGANTTLTSAATAAAAAAPAATVGAAALTVLGSFAALPLPDMVVRVGYVRAHRRMGRARFHCLSGCTCQPVVVDGWARQHQHQQLSPAQQRQQLLHWRAHASFELHVSQSPACQVGVTLLPHNTTDARRHKRFKVTGVMVSQAVQYPGPPSPGGAYHHFLHPDDP